MHCLHRRHPLHYRKSLQPVSLPRLGVRPSPGLLEALNLQQTWMSAQAKFVAGYSSPFWRESGLSGDAFSRVGPMVEIHDAVDESTGTFALFGFIGVPAVMRLDIEPGELQAACIRQLAQLFGEDAAEPVECAFKDWARDDFTVTAADIEELPAHAGDRAG